MGHGAVILSKAQIHREHALDPSWTDRVTLNLRGYGASIVEEVMDRHTQIQVFAPDMIPRQCGIEIVAIANRLELRDTRGCLEVNRSLLGKVPQRGRERQVVHDLPVKPQVGRVLRGANDAVVRVHVRVEVFGFSTRGPERRRVKQVEFGIIP